MRTFLLAFFLMAGTAIAQDTPAPKPAAPPAAAKKYETTETEQLKLQLKQKDAIIAQIDLNTAQRQMQDAMAAINAEAEVVKKAHGWDESVLFNTTSLTFVDPPKPPTPTQKPAPPK